MNWKLTSTFTAAAIMLASQASAQITFYEREGFRGQAFLTDKPVNDFRRYGFNDRAASAIVDRGHWEVCDAVRLEGRCVVLRPGSYDSLQRMGLDKSISSVRPIADRDHYANEAREPLSEPSYDYRRRPDERTYDARVTSVRAVVGPAEQRCWVERGQVDQRDRRGSSNVGGAIAGAIVGGILGHQIGGGRGNDVATAGGAVVGGVVGANVGRDRDQGYGRDVRRCETAASGPPDYWDVTYNFQGVEHRAQMSYPPGDSITVNHDGEPRG